MTVPLSEDLVDLGDGEVDTVLPLQEVGDLLPAALRLPLPQLPDPALHQRVHPAPCARPFLGLLVALQEG